MGVSAAESLFIACWFFFGSNLYASLLGASVWSQGQSYGFGFAVISIYLIFFRTPGLISSAIVGFFFLSLAVGCRPFYLFMLPALFALLREKNPNDRSVYGWAICGLIPYGVFLSAYNWLRFDVPWEFGHTYLPWSKKLEHGIFSTFYFRHNFYHAFLNPIGIANYRLEFNGSGTAFWLTNGVFVLALWRLFRSSKLSKGLRGMIIVAGILIWVPLLMHESNGWYQYGYRYLIDLLPLALLVLLLDPPSLKWNHYVWGLACFFLNVAGIYWTHFPK